MQSLSAKACKGRGSRLPARVLLTAPLARLHHGANTAAMGVRARQFRTMAVGLPQKIARRRTSLRQRRLLWRGDTNRDQRRIRSTWHRAAGSAAFAEELRLIARRATVSGDEDFIVLALHRAPRHAVRSDHPDARAGWTWRPFFTLRAWRTRRPCRTDRARIALGTLGSRWPLIALRTLAAGG